MTVHITPAGESRIRIGDEYVQLAAAAVVESIRRRSLKVRMLLQELLVEAAADARTAVLADLYADLAVLAAEVSAEEVRALNAAGLDGA